MTHNWPSLEAGEAQITDRAEVLWRQITKSLYDEDNRRPGLLACGPQAADVRKPSFARKSVSTAQDSRDWHQDHAASSSLGTWSLSVEDVEDAGLRAVDDSQRAPEPGEPARAPGHAYVDYRPLSKQQMKDARAKLLLAMLSRGEEPTVDIGFHGDRAA